MKKISFIIVLTICCLSVFSQPQSQLLEKYRKMALEYNHDLKSAEKNIAASMDFEKMMRADRKPSVGAGANFQYTGNPTELTLDIPVLGDATTFKGKEMRYGASLSVLQPLYTGGKILASLKMAEHQKSLAINQADLIHSSVCFQTDIQYWNSVARYEMVAIATDFRNSISSLVSTIKERVEVGLIDPQDLLMAEVKLNEADYQLLQAQSNFETSKMALNSIIGIELDYATEIEQRIPDVLINGNLLLSNGSDRTEIKMAENTIKMAKTSLRLNDAKYKPQLFAGADGSYSSPGYNFHSDLDPNYAVYAKLSIPIFEWGRRKSEKRLSKQKIGIATDNLSKVEDAINLEVQTARVALRQAIQRVELASSSLKKANENEQKAVERYNEGKISILEVIDAQTYRQTSQINYTQAKVAAQCHYSELIKALNGYQ